MFQQLGYYMYMTDYCVNIAYLTWLLDSHLIAAAVHLCSRVTNFLNVLLDKLLGLIRSRL